MAELVGGAALGAAAGKLLNDVLDALKDLRARGDNLQKLEHLLQRLQPFVRELLDSMQDKRVHPARKWLQHLQEQLKTAREVIQECSNIKTGITGIPSRVRSSRKFESLSKKIEELVSEASLAQWAEGYSTSRSLQESLKLAHDNHAEMMGKLEQVVEISEEILDSFTTEPLRFRKGEINHVLSRRLVANHTNNDAQSSTSPLTKKYWNRDADIAEPEVSFGGDNVAQQVISNLVNPERYRKWVGLWALGGSGKTFTARKIYNDNRIGQHFTGGRYWCTVSKDRPPIHILLRELYVCIGGKDELPDALEDARALLKTRLNRDKVLLILDDVWEPATLNDLDLTSDGKEGVILVTTRDAKNLRSAMGEDDIIQIQPLSEDDSWRLFSYHAFHVHNGDVPSDLEDVAKAVADECKGLPLALQVIGSTMAEKDIPLLQYEQQLGRSLRQEWDVALDKLRRANVANNDYETLYRRLQLSVDNLNEEDSRLQDCFFSFAAFPEDYEVDLELLVSIWIADGIVGYEEEDLAHREWEGKGLVASLVSKSMIDLIPSDDGNSCRVHDVMRDLAHRNLKWKINEEHQLVKIPPTERTHLYAPGLNSGKFPEDWTNSENTYATERLSLYRSKIEQLPERFSGPNLRVLFLTENYDLQALPPGFFMSLSKLTVLDLSYTGVKEISGAILRCLKSLVLLNLTACRHLKKISNHIGGLHNMQSILLDDCNKLWKLPRMKSLTKLHTLSLTGIDTKRRLSTMCFTRSPLIVRHALQLRSLKRLQISLDHGPFDISPLMSLEELSMRDTTSFPRGISELRNLKVFCVDGLIDIKFMPALEKLPFLEDLVMRTWATLPDTVLPESFGHSNAFPSLKRMWIDGFIVNEALVFYHGAMPKIQRLKMDSKLSWESDVHVPTSLMILGNSLNFLRLRGGRLSEFVDQVFREPSKFSRLEYLVLVDVHRLPDTIAFLPKLRWLQCDVERKYWPQNLKELEEQGKLKIEVVSDEAINLFL